MNRKWKIPVLMCLVIFMGLPGVCLGQDDLSDEEQLREIKEKLWPRAYAEQDVDLLDSLLAEEFRMIDAEGNWSTKAEELAWVKNHGTDYDSLVFEIIRLDVFENGSAIVAGQGVVEGTSDKGDYGLRYQSTNVMIKRDGRWQAVASHVSGVTPFEPVKKIKKMDIR